MYYRINGETYQDAATYYCSKLHIDVNKVTQTDTGIRLYVNQSDICVKDLDPMSSVGIESYYPEDGPGYYDYDNPIVRLYVDIPL